MLFVSKEVLCCLGPLSLSSGTHQALGSKLGIRQLNPGPALSPVEPHRMAQAPSKVGPIRNLTSFIQARARQAVAEENVKRQRSKHHISLTTAKQYTQNVSICENDFFFKRRRKHTNLSINMLDVFLVLNDF